MEGSAWRGWVHRVLQVQGIPAKLGRWSVPRCCSPRKIWKTAKKAMRPGPQVVTEPNFQEARSWFLLPCKGSRMPSLTNSLAAKMFHWVGVKLAVAALNWNWAHSESSDSILTPRWCGAAWWDCVAVVCMRSRSPPPPRLGSAQTAQDVVHLQHAKSLWVWGACGRGIHCIQSHVGGIVFLGQETRESVPKTVHLGQVERICHWELYWWCLRSGWGWPRLQWDGHVARAEVVRLDCFQQDQVEHVQSEGSQQGGYGHARLVKDVHAKGGPRRESNCTWKTTSSVGNSCIGVPCKASSSASFAAAGKVYIYIYIYNMGSRICTYVYIYIYAVLCSYGICTTNLRFLWRSHQGYNFRGSHDGIPLETGQLLRFTGV